jgi:peroxiredoxin
MQFEQAALQVVAVGLAQPRHARRYCGRLAPSVQCLSNEAQDLYRAYGLARGGLMQLAGPRVVVASLRTQARGYVWDGQVVGDPTMLPGTFVIDRQGRVRYAYYCRHSGDHPALGEVLAAAREASASGIV